MIIKDKIVLIAGASGGIGSALVKEFTQESCRLVLHTHNKEVFGTESVVKADFSSPEQIQSMYQEIETKFGGVDVVINTVGIEESAEDQLDTSKWQKMFATNLFGTIESNRNAIRLMKGKGGVIVNISSIMGNTGIVGESSLGYSVAKAALQKYSENAALMFAKDGIRIISISPGYTDTPIWNEFDETLKAQAIGNVPIKRFITPTEIAQFIVAIVKNDAVTGTNFTIAGGLNLKSII
jgi:3-oxoacyl-[acyl-carrier protein] reductase